MRRNERVLLTGSTGFIGGAVHAALTASGVPVTRLVRRHGDHVPRAAGRDRVVIGDLGERTALDDACTGARVVIHAASYVGPDEQEQRRVNVEGTAALLAAARAAGVERVVSTSTVGVYGAALPPGGAEEGARPAPRSALSRSRLAADELVLAAGGLVVRPNLVHGPGDRWFLAPAVAAMQFLGAWVGDGQARLSVIDRRTLGRLVAVLALGDAAGGVFHAALPSPVALGVLVCQVYARARVPAPTLHLAPQDALTALAPLGITESQVRLLTTDSWFASDKIWCAAGMAPGPDPGHLSDEALTWYARTLTIGHPSG